MTISLIVNIGMTPETETFTEIRQLKHVACTSR